MLFCTAKKNGVACGRFFYPRKISGFKHIRFMQTTTHHKEGHPLLGKLTSSRYFEGFILVMTICAGILIGMETSPELMRDYGHLLHALDHLILWTFTVEILLKMAAEGKKFWRFFYDGWHVFDFIIVSVSILPLFFPGIHTEFFAVFRLARILRVVRLIEELPKLQRLVHALLTSLPSMSYVALLLVLHFYVYAVTGVTLFGSHAQENFGSLPVAMVTLFQIITGDGWADIMRALIHEHYLPSPVIVFYFISFIVLGAMILLNLFIGIITSEMAEIKAEEDKARFRKEREQGHILIEDTIAQLEEHLQKLKHHALDLKAQNEAHLIHDAEHAAEVNKN